MLKLGDSAEVQRSFTKQDIEGVCELAGVDATTVTQVPEPLIAALFSDLLGTTLPGPGTMYMKQTSRHIEPAPIGASLTARVEVDRIRPEKCLVNLRTTCVDDKGTLLSEGGALVIYPNVAGD